MDNLASNLTYYIAYGLCVGAIYALIALGYTLVYGIIKLINFAHGEFYMAAAYGGFAIFSYAFSGEGFSLWLVVPVVVGCAAVSGGVIAVSAERIAYKPIRGAGRLAALLTALGLSFLLQNIFSWINRGAPMSYHGALGSWVQTSVDDALLQPLAGRFPDTIAFLQGNVGQIKLINFIYIPVVLVLTYFLWRIVQYTRFGQAMRAVSQDPDAAALMGIDINKVIRDTFLLGGLLAGVAGALDGFQFGVSPFMGFGPGLKAFIAAVIGGIGSIPGALLGGLLLGLIENLVLLTGIDSGYKDVSCYVVLILVLLVRPQGILGKTEKEKV